MAKPKALLVTIEQKPVGKMSGSQNASPPYVALRRHS